MRPTEIKRNIHLDCFHSFLLLGSRKAKKRKGKKIQQNKQTLKKGNSKEKVIEASLADINTCITRAASNLNEHQYIQIHRYERNHFFFTQKLYSPCSLCQTI